MLIKKSTITTEEYIITVYSVTKNNQKVDVKLLDGTPFISNLCITDGTFIYLDNSHSISYSICYDIKCIVLDALKYFEYWEDVSEVEQFELINSYSYLFT